MDAGGRTAPGAAVEGFLVIFQISKVRRQKDINFEYP